MEFRIADTFTDSLARLTGDEQKAVKTTAFDLLLDPANPAMSFHKLAKAKDKRFWSVRVAATSGRSCTARSSTDRTRCCACSAPSRMTASLALTRCRGVYPDLRGSTHRSPAKRAKSVSQEQSSAPCSIARAARWASLTRLPAIPLDASSRRSTIACRSPGCTTVAQGCASHASTTSKARPPASGLAKTRGFVLRRRNARRTLQLNATVSDPLSCPSSQPRASRWRGDCASTA